MTAERKKPNRARSPDEQGGKAGIPAENSRTSADTGRHDDLVVPGFPVVGLGSSAGGLQALEEFFEAMPEDSGMAFVVVAHLDPDHATLLPELLGRKTGMPASQVEDGVKLAPNRIFVIPPNKEMAIINGGLQLLEMSKPRGINLPIDTFLRSLAQDRGSRAIGIILSGTGTDGTLGVRAIKGEAGMVMAQDPDSAKYDGMPKSAVDTGLVDFVLPPAAMPKKLLNFVRHDDKARQSAGLDRRDLDNHLQKIFILLRTRTGHDFSLYKRNTINRRIERRMHLHQIDDIGDYVRYLQGSDSEISTLFKELLIGVTNFFRDPEAFEILKNKYLPPLLEDKPYDYQVRIWVPSCSTGEEPYSIAIIMAECMEKLGRDFNVQIFGTDLDEDAVKKARSGLYPKSIAADVSPERLKRFFIYEKGSYRVKQNIRDMAVFAQQNVIKDPPFTKLDLLCCRNLLIYFAPPLQKKLMPIFHYSLKPNGILFLGSSENIGQATDLFGRLDSKWKIFKRLPNHRSAHPFPDFPTSGPSTKTETRNAPEIIQPTRDVNTLKLLKAIIAQSNMPVCVVVDDDANIVYIHGRTGRFLEPAEGEVNNNLLEMAKPGLKSELTKALQLIADDRRESRVKGLRVKDNGGQLEVNLTVKPLTVMQTGYRGMTMVIFEEVEGGRGKKTAKKRASAKDNSGEVKRLEDDLQYTRESLQATIEELETSNEELKSTNEELQSTNEELETSKEELQSLNEESVTVNSELQNQIEQLTTARDDIRNLLEATEIATIFLDDKLKIRRFTAKATEIFPLTQSDTGRPISHFASTLKDVDLRRYTEEVLNDLSKIDTEVRDCEGKTYRMRVNPFRTVNNVIDGVVITFLDISDLKTLLEKEKRLAAVVKDSNDAITLQDPDGRIVAWNRGAEKMFGYSKEEALKKSIFDLVPPEERDRMEKLQAGLKSGEGEKPIQLTTKRLTRDGGIVPVWLTITVLYADGKKGPQYIATTERNLNLLSTESIQQLTGDDHGRRQP